MSKIFVWMQKKVKTEAEQIGIKMSQKDDHNLFSF